MREFSSLREYIENVKTQFLNQCSMCGQCIENCPVIPYTSFKNKPVEVIEKYIEFISNGKYAEDIFQFVSVCMRCGICKISCPINLDFFQLTDFTREDLRLSGFSHENYVQLYLPEYKYSWQRVMSGIQTRASNKRWMVEIRRDPDQVDVVFFPSCSIMGFADKMHTVIDLLKKMEINFITLGPFENGLCCGTPHLVMGFIDKAENKAKDLIHKVSLFRPQTLIVGCPWDLRMFKDYLPHFYDYFFEIKHYSQFIAENLNRLEFKRELRKTATIHDSCLFSRVCKDHDTHRKILKSIPGLTIVEMENHGENAFCCGENLFGEVARNYRKKTLDQAKTLEIELLTTNCAGCSYNFEQDEDQYPTFKIIDLITLIGEMQGIKHEDKLRKYITYHDVGRVLEEAKDCIEENGLELSQLQKLLPKYLYKT
jgi:Fe-S oxidoreductase